MTKRKKLSRNSPCFCGSGKKYKNCHLPKVSQKRDQGNGALERDFQLSTILQEQRQTFVQRFGREPNPGDKVFFNAPSEEKFNEELLKAMMQANIHPALIHAYEKTGRLVSEENKKFLSPGQLKEWQDAIDEYYAAFPEEHSLNESEENGVSAMKYFKVKSEVSVSLPAGARIAKNPDDENLTCVEVDGEFYDVGIQWFKYDKKRKDWTSLGEQEEEFAPFSTLENEFRELDPAEIPDDTEK